MLKSNQFGQWYVHYYYCRELNLFSPNNNHCSNDELCILVFREREHYQENCWLPLEKYQEKENFIFTFDYVNWNLWKK